MSKSFSNIANHLTSDGLAIFLFHGVIKKSIYRIRNYTNKHIETNAFEQCVKRLSSVGHAMSMDDVLASMLSGDSPPPNSFAITFDDGFENNLSEAAPILKKYNVPACFYVASGFIEKNGMSWIDQVELCIERFSPKELIMPWQTRPYSLSNIELEKSFLDEVRRNVKGNKNINPNEIVQTIYNQCGKKVITSGDGPLDQKLTWEQVRELSRDPLFTVGAHTHTHAILGYLDRAQMKIEIDIPIQMLKSKGGVSEVRHFSYPEGFQGSFTGETIELLKARGVVCSPTAIKGVNRASSDPFRLFRIMVD